MATIDELLGGAPQEVQTGGTSLDELLGITPAAKPLAAGVAPIAGKAPGGPDVQSTLENDGWQVQPVDPDSFSSTIGRSVDNLQASLGGTVEAVGEASGSDYLTQLGDNFRKEQQAEAAEYGQPSISSYKDIRGDHLVDDTGSFLKELGLSSLPSLATVGTGAAAGSAAGGSFGLPGRVAGGALGGFLAGFGLNVGEVQNKIKELDPDAKSPWFSIGAGAGMGALDAAGLGVIAKPFVRQFGKEAVFEAMTRSGIAKELAADTLKGVGAEAVTEGAQNVLGDVAAFGGADKAVDSEVLIENAINGMIGGGVAGGGLAGAGGLINAKSRLDEVEGTGTPAADPSASSTEPPGTLSRGFMKVFGGATDPLKSWARVSPTMKSLLEEFDPDRTGATASGATIYEDTDLMAGKWNLELDDAFETFSGNEDAFFEAMADPAKASTLSPTDQTAVAKARGTMDNILGEAKGAGLEVGKIKDYLPVKMDVERVQTPEFWAAIRPYYASDADTDAVVSNFVAKMNQPKTDAPSVSRLAQVDPITGGMFIEPKSRKKDDPESMKFKFGQGTIPPEFGHLEKSRSFGAVPQSVLLDFSDVSKPNASGDLIGSRGKRIRTALRDYTEGAAHRIAFAKRFGGTGEKANAKIAFAIKEAQMAGRPVQKLETDQLYDVLDAYNGMYRRLKDPKVKTVVSAVSTAMTVATLPLSTLASLPEIVTPMIRGDVGAALTSLVPAFREAAVAAKRTLLMHSPRSEFASTAAQANLTLTAAMNVASERLGDSVLGKFSAKVNKGFFLANGNTFFTHFMRTYAAKTAETIMNRNLHALASGVPISSAKGTQLANQLRSMGIPIDTNAEALAYWDPMTRSMTAAGKAYKALGTARFVSQTALVPNLASTPLWMNNGELHLFAMLSRYPTAFTNLLLPALFRKGRPTWAGSKSLAGTGIVGGLFIAGLMLSVGYIADELKMVAKTGEMDFEDERTETQRGMDVLNSTLTPIWASKVMDAIAAPRYGSTPVATVFGPVGGLVNDTVKAGTKVTIAGFEGDPMSGTIAQWLYKRTPAAFYRPGREGVKELAEDELDW